MSKRILNIIIAALAVVALTATLVFIDVLFPSEEGVGGEKEEQSTSSTTGSADNEGSDSGSSGEETTVLIVDKTKDANGKTVKNPIKQIEIALKEESFALVPDKDGILSVKAYADLPVASSVVEALVSNLALIEANRELESPAADADYGLDKPITFTVSYADGDLITYELGSKSPVSEEYYFRVQGMTKVYLVSSYFAGVVSLPSTAYVGTDLITAPTVEKDDANGAAVMRDITLSGRLHGDKTLTVRRTNSSDSDTMRLYNYWVEKPYRRGANDEVASAAFGSAYSLTAEGAEYVRPSAKQKTDCGFDKPYVVAKITTAVESSEADPNAAADATEEAAITKYYGVQEYTVTVGNQNEDGLYYVMVDELDVIYLVSEESMPWVETTYNKVVSTMLFLQDITGMGTITVTAEGKTSEFKLTHDVDADDLDDMLTVMLDGKQKSTSQFRNLYQLLMSVSRAGDAKKMPEGEPSVVIELKPLDTQEDVIRAELYRASGSLYTCKHSDGDVYAVSAGSVEKLVKQLGNYLNNKPVNIN